jgi:hypothetical protein
MKGRPRNPQRAELEKKYGLSRSQSHRVSRKKLDQLQACQSDAARRLLLGVGRKKAA